MKKIFIFFILLFLNSFNLFAGNFDVVARVNDKIITNYDLNNYVNISQLFFKDTDNSKNFIQEILDWIIDNLYYTCFHFWFLVVFSFLYELYHFHHHFPSVPLNHFL